MNTTCAVSVAFEEEGALIFSAAKSNKAIATTPTSSACARTGSAFPRVWWGDYLASLGAVRIAERELLALVRLLPCRRATA
jgi:N-methylhydantoinase B